MTVAVTASAADLPPGTAASEAVTVRHASTTLHWLSRQIYFSWQTSTAKVAVTTAAPAAARDTVKITIDGCATKPLTLVADGTVSYTLRELTRGTDTVSVTY